MARSLKKSAFLIILVAILAYSSSVSARDDWEYWPSVDAKINFLEKWNITLKNELRMEDDFHYRYKYIAEGGINYLPTDWLELGPAYKYESVKSSSGRYHENRGMFNITLKKKLWGFKLSNRLRGELRSIEDHITWRIRDKVTVKRMLSIKGFEFSPYVADELFYDSKPSDINKNRLYIGVEKKVFKYTSFDFFYMLYSQRDSHNHWQESHVLGTAVHFSL